MTTRSPIGLGRRALSSRYPQKFRSVQRSVDKSDAAKIAALQAGILDPLQARNITPPTLGLRQGPYMDSQFSQSSYDYKIGSNNWLNVMGKLVKRFLGVQQYEALVNAGYEIARGLGLNAQPEVINGTQKFRFPPLIVKEGRLVQITYDLPVFVDALFRVPGVTQMFQQVEQAVGQLERDENTRRQLDWMTLSLAHKRRSAQSKSSRDKFQYVTIDQNGNLQEIDENTLRNMNSLMRYDLLGVVSRRPSSRGLIAAESRFNERTGWVNPRASAEQRRGDSKMADLNAQASFLKSKLIQNAQNVFGECTQSKQGCGPQHYDKAFELPDVAQALWEYKKRNRLAKLYSKLYSTEFTKNNMQLSDQQNAHLDRVAANTAEKIRAVLASSRRSSKRNGSQASGFEGKQEGDIPFPRTPRAGAGGVKLEQQFGPQFGEDEPLGEVGE